MKGAFYSLTPCEDCNGCGYLIVVCVSQFFMFVSFYSNLIQVNDVHDS
jgi:hypothetical protein